MTVDIASRTGPMHVSEFPINCTNHDSHRTRTKAGIATARERGVSWGQHGKVLAQQNQDEAAAFAETLRPLLVELGTTGVNGPTAIAREPDA